MKDLKEQLNMFEAASCLGVLSQETTRETIHDDSMMDLGIKKTIDFDETPEPIKYDPLLLPIQIKRQNNIEILYFFAS